MTGPFLAGLSVGVLATFALVALRARRTGVAKGAAPPRPVEDILELLHETGRRALARESVAQTLRHICAELSERLGVPLVWVGTARGDGSVVVEAACGAGRALLDTLVLRSDGELDRLPLPCRALATGEAQLATEPEEIPEPYRSRSLELGIGAVAAFPLVRSGETFGVLAVHAASSRSLAGDHLALLRRLADLVALALVESEQREAMEVRTAALESTVNAILILDADERIAWANAAFETVTGWTRHEVAGRPVSDLDSDLHPPAFWQSLRETLRLGNVWRGEVFSRRKDGSVYVEEQTVTPVLWEDGSIRGYVAVRQDVTREKGVRERLRYLSQHDSLTDLPNRRHVEALVRGLASRARHDRSSSVLLVDADGFAFVNEAGGHAAGDTVLVELARLLLSLLRPGDELGRTGGDEFAVLLDGADAETARGFAEKLRMSVEGHLFAVSGQRFDLTVTIGIVTLDGTLVPADVLAEAAAALQAGKERGKNRVVAAHPGAAGSPRVPSAGARVALLRDALRSERLVLHLQPIVRLSSRRTTHYEVLLRMRGEDGVLVPPAEFLPAAERFGLMPQVDRWVLAKVLDLLSWRTDLALFMNLSGSSLADGGLLDEMERMVRARDLEPGRLSFEITETAAVGDVPAATEWLKRLRELGCRFALDDFGTGFSSFSSLQALPVDYVKIDGSFIRSLETERTNREIVSAIVAVAHSLGKETIAESVENPRALAVLGGLGVEYGQGWFLGRPMESPSPVGEDAEELSGVA